MPWVPQEPEPLTGVADEHPARVQFLAKPKFVSEGEEILPTNMAIQWHVLHLARSPIPPKFHERTSEQKIILLGSHLEHGRIFYRERDLLQIFLRLDGKCGEAQQDGHHCCQRVESVLCRSNWGREIQWRGGTWGGDRSMNGTQSASPPFPRPDASPHAIGRIRRRVLVQERRPRREMVRGGGGDDGMRQRLDAVDGGGGWETERRRQ